MRERIEFRSYYCYGSFGGVGWRVSGCVAGMSMFMMMVMLTVMKVNSHDVHDDPHAHAHVHDDGDVHAHDVHAHDVHAHDDGDAHGGEGYDHAVDDDHLRIRLHL